MGVWHDPLKAHELLAFTFLAVEVLSSTVEPSLANTPTPSVGTGSFSALEMLDV